MAYNADKLANVFFPVFALEPCSQLFERSQMKFMWTKPDVAAKVKMWGILWTTGSWIVMSMTAKQGATRTKLKIYCNRKTSNWRNKEDNHLKIKKHGGLLTQVGYVEIGQQYTLAKRELLPIFLFAFKIEEMGSTFCIFSTFLSIYHYFRFIQYKDLLQLF